MKKAFALLVFIVILGFVSCQRNDHFITDSAYRKKVSTQFIKQKELAKGRADQLFSVFDQDLSMAEIEALQFLFAYMPLSDLADYTGDFFLKNVRASFAARDTFSWGSKVPEILFRHFVLPVRVNNENLDSSRWVFLMELKDRIKKMSMKEAVLEVNHWCHEKVTYRGTDGRTSSPLASVKTAYGRCGEESTFTVAAMRSVGIPARQCYTPRWAHGDDNHAWVEVWVDGKWHFIGACEPEPDLDLAWFTAPAKRAMLVNTNVFGDYEGPEDVLVKDERFTRINILSNYTDTKRLFVKVLDEHKNPVDSVSVEFQLYNYAEFYPLHKTVTNANGLASLLTGYGDLIVWAAKNGRYGYEKVTVRNTDTAVIELTMKPGQVYEELYDLVPPAEQKTIGSVSDSAAKSNKQRLEFEDRIRGNYESTFIDSSKTYRLAKTLKMNADTLWHFLNKSRGNWRELIDFISGIADDHKSLIFPLLGNISEKDLRDVNPEVLTDNILNSTKYQKPGRDQEIFQQYVLQPRVDNEWLVSYKGYFQKMFDKPLAEEIRKDPKMLVRWIRENIALNATANYGRAPLTPIGSFELKVTDAHSRDILAIAVYRSLGIPARLEPGTRMPQYHFNSRWNDLCFEKSPEASNIRGTLEVSSDPENDRKPEYYIHFTIEKYEDGFFHSLDYEYDPVFKNFPCSLLLAPGYYLLVTGNRIAGGTVLAKLQFFELEADQKTDVQIELRTNMAPPPVLGTIDLKMFLHDLERGKSMKIQSSRGIVAAWLEPDKEPTKHFISDLKLKKREFEKQKGNILLLFQNEKDKLEFQKKNRVELPDGILYLVAEPNAIKDISMAINKKVGDQLPVISFINAKGDLLYISEGYRIGTGDELLRLMK